MKPLPLLVWIGILCSLSAGVAYAQVGKISGQVTHASTGEPIPGVTVVIEGTTQGAISDIEGYYSILNVRPGTYILRASSIGFTPQVQENVRVNIDLTAQVDFALQEEAVGLDEVVIVAEKPIVRRDVSANVANFNAQEIENIPVAGVDEVIDLQAGVESGMRIRGGSLDEVAFAVDGMTMRDGRDNVPFTGISYTAVDEVQVQTGGFNAEYGNVRSGLINVVMKEGSRDRYTADLLMRYSPPQRESLGPGVGDFDNYWMRPYLDPVTAFEGTSAWDTYERRQYPTFEGFNSISEAFRNDNNAGNDLSPEELQELFKWYRRKDMTVDRPDYEFDGSFGGPVPAIGKYLGDLRFMASLRQTQAAYTIPQSREAYTDRMGQIKLTANIGNSINVDLLGMYATQSGLNPNEFGFADILQGRGDMATRLTGGAETFGTHFWSETDVVRSMLGLNLTHTLSPSTFYEIRLQRNSSDYDTGPGRHRNREPIKQIGEMALDEAPYGFDTLVVNDPVGMWLGGNWSVGRDASWSTSWNGAIDITSQLNRFMQIKSGIEGVFTTHRSNHRYQHALFWQGGQNATFIWKRYPRQGAVYAQSKFEFEGIVANVGLRLDYFHAGGSWYAHELYDMGFSAITPPPEESIAQEPVDPQLSLSPRLGVSFPITENSKLFFNYGHFRQMLNPNNIYVLRQIFSGATSEVGNPNHPMPKTIAYELGYEHNIFNRFLLRMTGYYKDISEQPLLVGFHDISGLVNYNISLPYNYEDVRGFEISLVKNTGRFIRGFANFTYMARKAGQFGFGQMYENPVLQRDYLRNSTEHYPDVSVPEPFARVSLEFIVPETFGPSAGGLHPLGDWRINLLGGWRAGDVLTWTNNTTIRGVENNVRWTDDYDLDLRLSKNFAVRSHKATFFMDVSNVLNLKQMSRSAFLGSNDYNYYMQSLHLPADIFGDAPAPYSYIPGNDRPGDYRKEGVPFVPIEIVDNAENVANPATRPLYYERTTGDYKEWADGAWRKVDPNNVQREGQTVRVLKDKAYIDMPNNKAFTFLYPRRVRFGLRMSF